VIRASGRTLQHPSDAEEPIMTRTSKRGSSPRRAALAMAVSIVLGGATARAQIVPPTTPTIPPPAVNLNAFAFSQAPEGNVQVGAWQPGASFAIETVNGQAPVTFAVSAGPDSALFAIITHINTNVAKGTAPERLLHFTGIAPGQYVGPGRDIAVTLTATDAQGKIATRKFTLTALPARVAKIVVADASVVRSQFTHATVTLDLLPPGAKVDYVHAESFLTSMPPSITRFGGQFAPQIDYVTGSAKPSAVADASGKASFSLDGIFFAGDDAKTGPCGAGMRLQVTIPNQAPATVWALANLDPVTLAQPTVYQVDQTWKLNDRFKFSTDPVPGVCAGFSVFTSGTFPIGAFEDANHDIALAVRSGPVGTDCHAISSAWVLPDGFQLTAIDWDVHRDGTACCTGDGCLPKNAAPTSTVVVPGSIPSEAIDRYQTVNADDPMKDAVGQTSGANPAHHPRHIFNTSFVRLACKETPSNDNGVRVTLKSVTFEGPAGQTFP
jgi:hypothetical protein